MADIALVDRPEELAAALARMDGALVGVDVERADAPRYHPRAALVQLSDGHRCVIVDAVALTDLGMLQGWLADRTVVLHALENDLAPLEAAGVAPSQVEDTAVAAALLGLPTGLPALLAAVLGITLDHDKAALQRADWARRPLPPDMIAYAADDVVHLPALWRALAERLERTGRTEWYRQELDAVRRSAGELRRSWRRVRGVGRLDAVGRGVLRALWEEREAIAAATDTAPARLLRDEHLIRLATLRPTDPSELLAAIDDPRRARRLRPYARRLAAAVRRGSHAPAAAAQGSWGPVEQRTYDALRRARSAVARELGLDPGVLCPARLLKAAVAAAPADPDALCAGLRPWQAALLREPLWAAYQRARSTT